MATNGAVGGVIGGANWQFGSFVFGADADYGWAAGHGNSAAPVSTFVTAVYDFDLQWTSHVRGRLGYDLSGTLLYVAGGVAFAYANVSRVVSRQGTFVPTTFLTSSNTYTGGSVGAGVERAITNQLTGRLEYLHPIPAHGFDGRRYVLVSGSQELLGVLSGFRRTEQRAPMVVDAMKQDRQQ